MSHERAELIKTARNPSELFYQFTPLFYDAELQ